MESGRTLPDYHRVLNGVVLSYLSGMAAYSELQEAEFANESEGYTAVRHQREVGTGYFDAVSVAISGGQSSTTVMAASTETQPFHSATERKGFNGSVSDRNQSDTSHAGFVNAVYREGTKTLEELAKEAYYARIKEAYKEI